MLGGLLRGLDGLGLVVGQLVDGGHVWASSLSYPPMPTPMPAEANSKRWGLTALAWL